MRSGFIKIDRKILNWEWYSDVKTARVFIHLLLTANWEDGTTRGIKVPRGSLLTSYRKLAAETGLSLAEIRRTIINLQTTHEITRESHSNYTLINIENYGVYQGFTKDEQHTKQHTERHTKNTQIDTRTNIIKEDKKSRTQEVIQREIYKEKDALYHAILDYANEGDGSSVNPMTFFQYYENAQWKEKNGNPIKDWTVKFKAWEKNNGDAPKKHYSEKGHEVDPSMDDLDGLF